MLFDIIDKGIDKYVQRGYGVEDLKRLKWDIAIELLDHYYMFIPLMNIDPYVDKELRRLHLYILEKKREQAIIQRYF